MLKFQFNCEGEVKDYLIREEIKSARIARIIIALIFMIPAIIVGIVWYSNYIALIFSITIIICSFIFVAYFEIWDNPLNRNYKLLVSNIVIENDTIERIGVEGYRILNLQDIKEVRDMGTFYAIIFYFPNRDRTFICQKDLIEEGTIEEFEHIFEDKIVRWYETK